MTSPSSAKPTSTSPAGSPLADRATAVFAFAAYHALESGQRVRKVARADSSGHRADDEAVAALARAGLVRIEPDDVVFTQAGEEALEAVIAALRRAVPGDTLA